MKQKASAAKIRHRAATAARQEHARKPKQTLIREHSPEFDAARREAIKRVVAKYAYTAQHEGFVLRKNPLKLAPHRDYVFDRISRAEYGFRYLDDKSKLQVYFPSSQELLKWLDPYWVAENSDEDEPGFVIAERLEFLPGQPEVTHDADDCRVLNLWHPPGWSCHDEAPTPSVFLEHIEYLFDGNSEAIEHVLNYLGHLVQRPADRVSHALLITSKAKGIGKSTFGAIVRRLVGERNSRVVQTKDLKAQFDGWLVGKLVIQVDEVYEAGNWDLANKLKPLITEPTVSVNVKYGPQMEIENHARFIMFSNHTAPLDLEAGDRRYFVFDSKAQPRNDAYYDRLHECLENPRGMEAIYSFLMKRDLTAFNPHRRPPMTEAKQAVIEASTHPLRVYISDAIDSGHFLQQLTPEFSLDELQRQLQKDGYGVQSKNLKELGEALEAAGVTKLRKSANGSKRRLYRLPEDVIASQQEQSDPYAL
jgi:Family of unknown function (DUF5906)